jgi:hypothetical protein
MKTAPAVREHFEADDHRSFIYIETLKLVRTELKVFSYAQLAHRLDVPTQWLHLFATEAVKSPSAHRVEWMFQKLSGVNVANCIRNAYSGRR